MRQLLLIKTPRGSQQVDDLIGDFDANHKFSEKEIEIFDIVPVEDEVVESYKEELNTAHMNARATGSELLIARRYYDRNTQTLKFV